jgi:SlyX protein
MKAPIAMAMNESVVISMARIRNVATLARERRDGKLSTGERVCACSGGTSASDRIDALISLARSEIAIMNNDIVERLEIKLAFLERATNELSDVVYKQQLDIAALNERLTALSGRVDAFKAVERDYTAEEERPPHY